MGKRMEMKGEGKMEARVSSLLEHIRGISLAVCGEDPALEAFARRMWDRIQESQTGGTEK